MKKLRNVVKKVPGFKTSLRSVIRFPNWLRLKLIISRLYPVSTDKPLVRFGPKGDGGYLIPDDLEGIVACFSPGVSSVSGFENDCAERGIKVYLADASVEAPALPHPLFAFSKKFIGGETEGDFVTLDQWIKDSLLSISGDLIMQMDIEGHEYEALDQASTELINRFRIIVIEFHRLDRFNSLMLRVFRKLLSTHTCVHIHPNNFAQPKKLLDLEVPPLMEFTFLRKDRINSRSFRSVFPHSLDSDNTSKVSLPLPSCWYKQVD